MRNLFIVLLLLTIGLPGYGQEVELEMATQVAHNFHLQSLKHLDILGTLMFIVLIVQIL